MRVLYEEIAMKSFLQANFTFNVKHYVENQNHYYETIIYINSEKRYIDLTKEDKTEYKYDEGVLDYLYTIEYLEEQAKKNPEQNDNDNRLWIECPEMQKIDESIYSKNIYFDYVKEYIVIDYLYDSERNIYNHLYCCKKNGLYYYKLDLTEYKKDLIKKYSQPYFFNSIEEKMIDITNDYGMMFSKDTKFFGLYSYKYYTVRK